MHLNPGVGYKASRMLLGERAPSLVLQMTEAAFSYRTPEIMKNACLSTVTQLLSLRTVHICKVYWGLHPVPMGFELIDILLIFITASMPVHEKKVVPSRVMRYGIERVVCSSCKPITANEIIG